jgi:hypothetical protein
MLICSRSHVRTHGLVFTSHSHRGIFSALREQQNHPSKSNQQPLQPSSASTAASRIMTRKVKSRPPRFRYVPPVSSIYYWVTYIDTAPSLRRTTRSSFRSVLSILDTESTKLSSSTTPTTPAKRCRSAGTRGEERKVVIDDLDSASFTIFVNWLYTHDTSNRGGVVATSRSHQWRYRQI